MFSTPTRLSPLDATLQTKGCSFYRHPVIMATTE